MGQRETAVQKRTRIGMLLADYDDKSKTLRKLSKDVESMKEQIREIPAGTYGDWIRSKGTPREIMDQAAVKADYQARGVPMPMVMTKAPVVVTAVTK